MWKKQVELPIVPSEKWVNTCVGNKVLQRKEKNWE